MATSVDVTPMNSALRLRHTFVSMLFALVIAEIAIQTSNLAAVASNEWATNTVFTVLRDVPSPGGWLMLAPLSHLLLVFILISMSWVGWSLSIERGGSPDVREIFSIAFLLLLIELLLVVLYFVLARNVELQVRDVPHVTISSPSSIPEARWLTAVFFGYVIWDIFADALPRYYPKEKRVFFSNNPFASWLAVLFFGLLARCWVSFVCAWAAIFVLWRSLPPQTPFQVVFADLALLSVVVWFRMGKGWEPWVIENIMPFEKNRKGGREFERESFATRASLVLIPIYILFLSLI